mgnify:CR=1 FL=1
MITLKQVHLTSTVQVAKKQFTGLAQRLTRETLRWPLDVTTCQNDKLLFVAPPVVAGLWYFSYRMHLLGRAQYGESKLLDRLNNRHSQNL